MNAPIFILNNHAISAGDMTGNLASSIIEITEVRHLALHSVYSGAPVGSLVISGSNDGVNFAQISSTSISAAGQNLQNLTNQAMRYIQITYAKTSGSGTLDCYLSGKK